MNKKQNGFTRFIEKKRLDLIRFMYGRYGWDKLNNVLLIANVVVVVIFSIASPIVTSLLSGNVLAHVILIASYFALSVSLILAIFLRTFSKNIYKRRQENEKFFGFFKLQKNKWRDRKTHVYRKCPSCKAVLRLPKAKGKHNVVCPRCKNRFSVRG